MAKHLHLDFETFSEADIRDVGEYRYAFDPSTEILCAAMAFDRAEPVVWHAGLDEIDLMEVDPYFDALRDPEVLVYAHNAMFEMSICQALLKKTWGIECPDLSRFRCTMSLARRAALPAKLEKLAEVLGLSNQKDQRGKTLLKKFSMMQPAKKPSKKNPQGVPPRRIMPTDEPQAFAELLAYCAQDVRAEQEVQHRLAYFDDDLNNANYSLDARINARGVPVNLNALRHAQTLIDEETAIVSAQFRELCGFEVTQNAVFLQWLHREGAHLDNLQAETIETFLEDCEGVPDGNVSDAVRALRLKQSIAYASIKKVKTMIACAGPHDNRIRGMMNHHGATTGRWTASLVQFQNMKRATIKHSEDAYREICAGVSREMLELCYGPVLEVISSCIRHFVHDVKSEPYSDPYHEREVYEQGQHESIAVNE
jgi:DNA polymerase